MRLFTGDDVYISDVTFFLFGVEAERGPALPKGLISYGDTKPNLSKSLAGLDVEEA